MEGTALRVPCIPADEAAWFLAVLC